MSAEVRGIQRAASGSNVSHSRISPDLSSFRSAANIFTFSWEVGLVIETCQEQKLHHCSLQGEDMNSDISTGSLCCGKPLMLFLSFIVLSDSAVVFRVVELKLFRYSLVMLHSS